MNTLLRIVVAALAAAVLTVLAPPDYMALVAYACAPIAVIVAVLLRLIKTVDTVTALPIIGFIPWLAVTWPMTVIYFAIAAPEASYITLFSYVPFLLRAEVLISAVLLFLAGYCIAISPLLLGHLQQETLPAHRHRTDAEWWLTAVGAMTMTFGWAANLIGLQGKLLFLANGLRNFLTGLILAAGYRWGFLSRARRWFMICALLANAIANTIANARGPAVTPILLVLVGYVFSPKTTRRMRFGLLGGALLMLPVYTVIGNQTRAALHSVGFRDFDQRAAVLAEALSGEIVHESGFIADTMSRLFSTGGHALLVANWDRIKIEDFDLELYGQEFYRAIVPSFFADLQQKDRYTGTQMLREYGFLITDQTSVEVSLIGSLCVAGGPELVGLGGFILGLFHWFLARIIARFRHRAWVLPFSGSMLFQGMLVLPLDMIQLMRTYYWSLIYIGVVTWVIMLAERLMLGGLSVTDDLVQARAPNIPRQ